MVYIPGKQYSARLMLGVGFVISLVLVSYVLWFIYDRYGHRESAMTVTMLSVGQGDSVYIRFRNGSDLLIDAGRNDQVLHALAQAMPWWDRGIDTLVLTHPDSDHIGGAVDIMQSYRIGRVIDCGDRDKDTAHVRRVYAYIAQHTIPLTRARAGDRWESGSGEYIEVLSPSAETSVESNDCSIVLDVRDRDARAMFMGDASVEIERQIVSTYGAQDIDLLKVGHHGSSTSTAEEFIIAMRPEIALISAGQENAYGHPHQEVIDRLVRHGVHIWDTRIHDAVECVSNQEVFVCE